MVMMIMFEPNVECFSEELLTGLEDIVLDSIEYVVVSECMTFVDLGCIGGSVEFTVGTVGITVNVLVDSTVVISTTVALFVVSFNTTVIVILVDVAPAVFDALHI